MKVLPENGSPTKCRSNKRRMDKTLNDKMSKDKTPNGTKHRMEKTPNGTKRRMELTSNGTKGRMGQNIEWKKRPNGTKRRMEKHRMGQNVEWKNTEWDKMSNVKTSNGTKCRMEISSECRK